MLGECGFYIHSLIYNNEDETKSNIPIETLKRETLAH